MILLKILLGFAGVALVTSLLDEFYNEFAKWLKTVPRIVEKAVDGILIGVKAFIDTAKQRLTGFGKEISHNYSLNGEQWLVTTISRDVHETEIPEEITLRANGRELELTDELELVMSGGRNV